jgi:PAS domain S-box-containing protein
MPDRKAEKSKYLRALIAVCLFFGLSAGVLAEKLAFKTYTSADGLANDTVNRIVRDSRGFLWFCTAEGLSRFDGYKFKNYTQEQGLPHRNIYDFLETSDGTYFVATSTGLAVFNPQGRVYRWNFIEGRLEQNSTEPPLFKTYFPPEAAKTNNARIFTTLAEDARGNLYAGTNYTLYRVVRAGADWQFERVENADWNDKSVEINQLFKDSRGHLWVATNIAIYRILPDGAIEKISDKGGRSVFESRDGKIWLDSGGNDIGIRVYEFPNADGAPVLKNVYTMRDGLPKNLFTNAVAETSDGQIFVNSDSTLLRFIPGAKADEPKFQLLGVTAVTTVAAYRNQGVWLGFLGKGVGKFTTDSFVSFAQNEGVPERLSSLFQGAGGEIFFTYFHELFRVGGEKVERVAPRGLSSRSWGATFLDLQSKDGDWWIGSANGLLQYKNVRDFKDLAATSPARIYTVADGLQTDEIFTMFEDSRGDLWFSTIGAKNFLHRLEKATGKITVLTSDDGLPTESMVNSYGEDASGNVWFSFYGGETARYKDGKFRIFTNENLLPRGAIIKMTSDSKGRFWLASSSRGIFRTDDPNAETPAFTNFSTANGLPSNQTTFAVEDDFGRMFIGTGRGIARLEPDTGKIKIYTTLDGLPGNVAAYGLKDKSGNLWFASFNSVTKFSPQPDKPTPPPPIFIDGLSVNGTAQNISDLGETEIKNLEFSPDERRIQIGFFAISFESGESLRYQYKIGDADWSTPTGERSVSFDLAAGSYNFSVRAINSDGVLSDKSASFSFKILPPVWQRWWFLTLAFLLVGGAIFVLDRYRVAKTRQIEAALLESKESEKRFRTLAETASDAILTIDTESRIIFANQAIEKVFGYRAEEIIGQKLTRLMPERMRDGHNTGLNRFLDTNRKHINWSSVPLVGLHKSGEEIPLEVSFGEFERDGKRFFTGIARDVSERKRAEAELQKAREEKFRELERVRTRIATDLHDDIGSSLTQIAVLTEVARGQASSFQAETLTTPLERIKNVSKELVAVMSDVVWAINPQKDFLHDLVQRMRRFASDVFTGRGVRFEFVVPEIEGDFSLGANIRREVFAIFKESVNNAVKYSECSAARAEFRIEDNKLFLAISDNGRGFDTEKILSADFKPEMGGNGLVNIQRRVAELGGKCEIISEIGQGTIINLVIPL